MAIYFGIGEERAVAAFIHFVRLILLEHKILAIRHQTLKSGRFHFLELKAVSSVHSQYFLDEPLHLANIICISRLIMQPLEVRKPFEFVSIEIEENLRMFALYSGVFLGSKEESRNVETMNDFCQFQVMHLEVSFLF